MTNATAMPILIVDDYNTMIRIMRNLLRQLGFTNIDEASDGRAALAKMRTRAYAVVISDWAMPGMSGEELLAQVRADARIGATPMIIVAQDGETDATTAKAAGASACIIKPVSTHALKDALLALGVDMPAIAVAR
jgi:two-component system chemotaxis response regulator CheY